MAEAGEAGASERPPIACPKTVLEKVRQFAEHLEAYKHASYSEAQLRIDFINPMLEALGWDVHNKQGYAEAYRDVVYEDALKIGGSSKAPDYGFYIGGRAAGGGRKFFLEAKKPAINVRLDGASAYQLRRYAWTARLPLSILTNFEHTIVYDTRIEPRKHDLASTASVLVVPFQELAQKWHDLASLFSVDAIKRGAFDRFAQQLSKKTPAKLVDDAFLEEIEGWRESLARNMASKNKELSVRDLNFAVQRTIDRIIFLRMCEDRGIEESGRLQQVVKGTGTYQKLADLFRAADDRYNSGIFHFPVAGRTQDPSRTEAPDDLTLTLTVDDYPVQRIVKRLYDSAYEFSVLPPEILGQIYERFLGKIINLGSGRSVQVVEKPEVRKQGGVYYTPSFIVDYIVRHSLGPLLQEKTADEAASVRVLDPACGSGSFLIGAYQYLLDWHQQWYVSNEPHRYTRGASPALMRVGTASTPTKQEFRLTTRKRKEILLNSIFGVDIDPQAVEVTKLSLLLKVLEGESHESIDANLKLLHERALPDLGRNIKCGNSLIDSSFLRQDNLTLSEGDRARINVFDWERGFPEILQGGGFEVVIGNPPYIFGEFHDANTKAFIERHMQSAVGQYDTYWLFVERCSTLTRSGGRFSLIVPDAMLARDECVPVRDILLANGIDRLYHCGLVFSAAVSAAVFSCGAGTVPERVAVDTREHETAVPEHTCSADRFRRDRRRRFLIHATDEEAALISRIEASHPALSPTIGRLSRGEELGKNAVLSAGPVPIMVGDDISRYSVRTPSRYIQAPEKNLAKYASPKIVIVKTGVNCVAALDRGATVTMQSVYNLHLTDQAPPIESILAILNSRLVAFLIRKTFTAYKLLFPQLNQTTIEELPIATPTRQANVSLANLVTRMIDLKSQLLRSHSPHDLERLQREIEATDCAIDELVFDVYDLSTEQRRLIQAT